MCPVSELCHREAIVNGLRFHYVEAGTGPVVLLLHGFPDFWYSWRFQIQALTAAGFHVVAPTFEVTTSRPSRQVFTSTG